MQGGEVDALAENAFLGCAVAEEGDGDLLGLAAAKGQRIAHGERNGRADHGRSADHIVAHVDEMHRAAFAAGNAGRFAVELGHHALEIAALGEIGGVPAIGRRDDIAGLQRVAHADSDELLPDREMNRAFDLVAGVDARNLLLDAANPPQRAVYAFDIRVLIVQRNSLPMAFFSRSQRPCQRAARCFCLSIAYETTLDRAGACGAFAA